MTVHETLISQSSLLLLALAPRKEQMSRKMVRGENGCHKVREEMRRTIMRQSFEKNINTCLLPVALLAFLLFLGGSASAQIYSDIFNFNSSTGDSPTNPQVMAQGQDGNLYGTLPQGFGNSGVVFKFIPATATYTILHYFAGTDGSRPVSGLTLGLDGNFYGTTVTGGSYNSGTIFKITPSGTFTSLYTFTAGTDGGYPYGTPILGNDGNLYGVTQYATAYKITPSGVFTLLGTIPSRSYAPLYLGRDGNFYGTTLYGGTLNQGTVFKMNPSGVVTIIYNFDTTHGAVPYAGVVQSGDGSFFGTTTAGGTGGGGVVYRVTQSGNIKVLHNFPVGTQSDGYDPIANVLLATDGFSYGTAWAGGLNNYGVVFSIAPTGSYSILNQFDKPSGSNASSNMVQHTNGSLYGMANGGLSVDGVIYQLNVNLGITLKPLLYAGKVGSAVQILGSGLTGATSLKFNGEPARFTLVSDNYLTTKVPSGATTGPITVKTPAGTYSTVFNFYVIPKVISFTPTSGQVGTSVVITGNSFTGATKVTFGGVAATTFTVDSDTQITATVPSGAQTGKIGVTTAGGTGASSAIFTVLP